MDNGCIISSMSWGTDVYEYSMESYNLDKYLYSSPNHVALIAANNNGHLSYNFIIIIIT